MKTSFCSIAYRNLAGAGIPGMIGDLKAAGYDGLELWWPHVESKSDAELREIKSALAEAKLAVPMLSPYLGNFNLPMTNHDEMIARTRASAPVAEKLGAPLLRAFAGWTCECSSLTASEEYWQYNLKGFREMATIAANHGRTLAIETHSMTLADSVVGMKRLIDEADGRLRVNFQLDTLAENSKLPSGVAVYEALKPWIVHMHAHVLPTDAKEHGEQQQLLTALKRDGFAGYISIEHCSGKGDPKEVAVSGIAMMRSFK